MRMRGCVAPHKSSMTSDSGLVTTLRNIQKHAISQRRRAIATAASIMKAVMPICACTYLKLYQADGILIISRTPAVVSVPTGARFGLKVLTNITHATVSTTADTVFAIMAATTGLSSGRGPSTSNDTGQYR